jgi:thioredoxin-related protein
MRFLSVILALFLALPAMAVEMGDDGLHKPAWLSDTFKDLAEDFAEAQAEGKRVVLIVEQRGCIYCTKMHEETFTEERVKGLLENGFFPIQVNLHGDTEIVDTDGEALAEKKAARKWGVMFTPTMIFLPPELDPTKSAVQQAVGVMPGAYGPGTTFDMFNWILEERYLNEVEEDFQRYHARMIRERNDGDTR